ncbi:MAG: sugar transferase [Lachnospiraceae bacterium]|nr:sugar transferase [Lachnospiraceae bacterium]
MYKRNARGWTKHLDFIIIDEIALHLAYVISYMARHGDVPYHSDIYMDFVFIIAFVDALVIIFFNTMHNVLKRGYLKEFYETIKQCLISFAFINIFVFSTQRGQSYSRIVLFLTLFIHIIFGYVLRILWKKRVLNKLKSDSNKSSMLAVLDPDTAEGLIKRLSDGLMGYNIVGIVFGSDSELTEVSGIPVVCELDETASYIMSNPIDAVYIDCPISESGIGRLMDECYQMAVPVHYHVSELKKYGMAQFVEKIGGTTCLTTTLNYASSSQLLIKRMMDIAGGLVGSVITLILMVIIGPMIKIASPGPILYSQERVGLNGKRFYILKFRSMYMDADKRKAELMEQNRVKDGMMFKMDFDPRVIGNKELPDGTKKTGIGEFIRRTSLDEFPQFFNVLAGSMSLVGTRPPTVDEWEKYEYRHRARLSCKPGITGLWQVSGRSNITDFEQVVDLDTQYISNWGLGLDIKILFKTIAVVLGHKGAM